MAPPMKEAQPPAVDERLSMRSDAHIEILFHWQRYQVAASVCAGKRVLDLASGDGYGSHHLAQHAASVVGVDVDERAVTGARNRYRRDNLTYLHGSAERIPLEPASVDLVVSFETLEHLAEPAQRHFLDEIDRVLAPDGMLLISSPDRQRTESSGMRNPFHLHELTRDELMDTLRARFAAVELYLQEVNLGAFLWPETGERALQDLRIDHSGEEAVATSKRMGLHLYLVAACARQPGALPSLASVCHEVSRRGVDALWNEIGALRWQRDQAAAERDQLRKILDVDGSLRRQAERAGVTVEHHRAELERYRARVAELEARPWWLVALTQNPAWRAARSAVGRTPVAKILGPLKERAYHRLVRPR
jgi:SAM-dependent methyltransferase